GGLGRLGRLPDGPIVFSKFFPIIAIEMVFIGCIALSAIGEALSGLRYWQAMSAAGGGANGRGPAAHLWPTVVDILRHRRFRQCTEAPAGTRPTHREHFHRAHLAIFYGFLGLVVTTASVGIGIYAFGYLTPWPVWHPVKILGNVSGVAVAVALAVFFWRRIG